MEKFKEWIKEHKGLAAVLLGLLLAGIYILVRRKNTSSASEYQAARMNYAPASGGSGGGSADAPASNSTGDTAAIMSTVAKLGETMQDVLGKQSEQNQKGLLALGELIKSIPTPAAMPNVPAPSYTPSQPAAAATVFQTPTATIFGGSGGGMVYAENTAQLQELFSGGSRNMGGSYAIDFKNWEPAQGSTARANQAVRQVTGKTGTIEQQLSGMSQADKLASLKKAGLVN